jgi:uncharacterized membrane protein
MASHFDAHGNVNGWQTKQAFFLSIVTVSVLATVVGFAVPLLISVLPKELINLPNKKYWLSPEREKETLAYLQGFFAWFGCALFLVLILVFQYAIDNNLHPHNPPPPERMWVVLAGFVFVLLAMSALMLRKFLNPPQDHLS